MLEAETLDILPSSCCYLEFSSLQYISTFRIVMSGLLLKKGCSESIGFLDRSSENETHVKDSKKEK